MTYIKKMFSAKILLRGGHVRRTIGSLPRHVTLAAIKSYAYRHGYGFRVERTQIVIYS